MIKKISLVLIVLISSLTTFGQAKKAQKGYYYDKSGVKHEGEFVYKIGRTSEMGYLIEYKNGLV